MTTKRALILSSFSELGLASHVFDASPERMQDALGKLNRLAAQWAGMGVALGYVAGDDIDAESGLAESSEEAVVTNLALRMAPSVGKTSDRLVELKIAARNALNALLTINAKRPEVPYPSRLPVGSGNKPNLSGRQYFPETDQIVGLTDPGA